MMTARDDMKTILEEIAVHHRPYEEDSGVYFCREECCHEFWPCKTYLRTIQTAQILRIDLELNY